MDIPRIAPCEIPAADEIYRFGPFILNVTRKELRVPLSRRPMQLLIHLVRNPKKVFTVEQLMMQVWRENSRDRSALWHQIANVRKALRDSAKPSDFIETTREGDVKFIGTVETVSSSEPADDPGSIIIID